MQPLESITIEGNSYYEKYPLRFNCVSLGVTLLSYALGTAIFYFIEPVFGLAYVLFCLLSVLVSLKFRCSYCYYYGKRCPSGLGVLGKLLFRKGEPERFGDRRNLIVAGILDFGAMLIAILGGVALCVTRFSPLTAALLAAYILVAVVAGFAVKKVFCGHCEQGRLGCPAYEGMKGKGSKR
jgi:hypothetical protein